MRKRISVLALAVLLAGLPFIQSCSTMGDFAQVLMTLKRLQFKIGGVHDFSLLGVKLFGKSSMTDLTADEGLRLFQGFGQKRLPVEMTLDILVQNPNDGSGGSTRTISTLTGLESRLLIDGTPTVYGNIDDPIEIPGMGQATTIPIRWSLDLYEFFGYLGYQKILGLALDLGGQKQNAGRIALDAQPRASTPYGEIVYPGRITIVSTEFR